MSDVIPRHANACHRKKPYRKQAQAEREAVRMTMRYQTSVGAYFCTACKHWHVGQVKNIAK